jgi:uncharacterized protein
MKQRIIGFDLARAYAIFGMYIVNFNIVFGNYNDKSPSGKFLSLFSGNSSTLFVMLAGMGVAIMTNRTEPQNTEERKRLKKIINKRAWFLFVLGLLLYVWWPADILHFYGAYMHIAALLLFVNRRNYLLVSALAILIFHLLLLVVPYETGWNFDTLAYNDFWTIPGFIRNTFYNGWNPLFPWLAFFTTGMYLGKLDWTQRKTQITLFTTGLILFSVIAAIQLVAAKFPVAEELKFFITADYLPPFLPFIISTTGVGLMLISLFIFISHYVSGYTLVQDLAKTGQMTLTHYLSHLTIGMLLFALLTGKQYYEYTSDQEPTTPIYIFLFSTGYFICSYYFSRLWLQKHKNGPFETLMRKIAG